jgi:hypothetical protein
MRLKSTITILLLGGCLAWAQGAKPATGTAKKAAAQAAAKSEAAPAAPSGAQPTVGVPSAPKTVLRGARRDPFISPIVKVGVSDDGGSGCTNGKRCLVVAQLQIMGVAKTGDGMIAVVTSKNTKRTYFLRENDPVYNGYVLKITDDSVVFKENVLDNLGRPVPRDVEKRVTPPAAS